MTSGMSDYFSTEVREVTESDRAQSLAELAATVDAFWRHDKTQATPDGLVVVMPEGFGKSFLAAHLIRRGFKVVVCCKSNAQVSAKYSEIKEKWPTHPEVQRLLGQASATALSAARHVSREQHFVEALSEVGVSATDYKLTSYATTSPYSLPGVDESKSIEALRGVFLRKGISADADDFFAIHYRDYRAERVNGRKCATVLMTLASFQALCTSEREAWWRQLGLVTTRRIHVTHENHDRLRRRLPDQTIEIGDRVSVEAPSKIAVIIDDPDRGDVDWLRRVPEDTAAELAAIRRPLTTKRKRQEMISFWKGLGRPFDSARVEEVRRDHQHPEGYSVHRIVPFKGSMYVERPPELALGFGLKTGRASPKIVVTSTEYITGYYALKTLQRGGLNVLDHMDLFRTENCDVTAISSVITRKKNHALLLPIVEQLRKEFPDEDITLIADGLGCEYNLSNSKGRNDLAEKTTIIKLSWSHPGIAATVGAHFPEATNYDLLNACLLGDVGNQALGRNQGFRFRGKQAILLIDPRWYSVLIENNLLRYELNPWSSSLPSFNKRLSKKAATLAFKVSSDQSPLEKRLIQLIAGAEDFGMSNVAEELMAGRPAREQRAFQGWRDSQLENVRSSEEEAARQLRRKKQLAEAQRRFREKAKAAKTVATPVAS
jgi:hypothetical protein